MVVVVVVVSLVIMTSGYNSANMRTHCRQIASFVGGLGPCLMHGSLGPTSPHPGWHIDRFIHCCGLVVVSSRWIHTDRHL